jgi:uncharacterized protein with PQ loop repeat
MKLHELTGSLGTAIVVGGYIHQVARLVRTHRAENVSATAHLLWAFASGLLLVHAMGMQSVVFTVLMVSETICCVLIAAMATIYRRFESPRPAAAEVPPSAPDRPQP